MLWNRTAVHFIIENKHEHDMRHRQRETYRDREGM